MAGVAMKAVAITAALALLLGLAAGHWFTSNSKAAQMQRYETRIAQMQADNAQAVADANADALRETDRLKGVIKDAQEQHGKETARLRANASNAWTTYRGLRDSSEAFRMRMSEYSDRAIREYAGAASVVLTESAERYAEVAAVADQCIADLGLTREAWPK